jgi:hypothetical protein
MRCLAGLAILATLSLSGCLGADEAPTPEEQPAAAVPSALDSDTCSPEIAAD